MENSVDQKNRVLQLEHENSQLRKILGQLGVSLGSDLDTPLLNLNPYHTPLPHWDDSLRPLLDNMTAMIGYWDKNLHNRYCNKAYSIWFGVSAENLHGKHIKELLGEKIYQLNLPFIQAVLLGTPQQFEREIPTPDGTSVRYSLAEYIPEIIDGQVEGFFVYVSDITKIKQSEMALRESEKRYETVIKDQTELISRWYSDGTYIFANEIYQKFFGKSEAELIGNKWSPVVYKDDLQHVEHELSKLNPENPVVMIENRVYSASGEIHWMQFSNRGTFDSTGQLLEIQSVGRDITKQKNAERELKLASAVFKNTIEGILLTDASGKILSVNPAFTTITGFDSVDAIGKTPRIFKSGHHDNAFYQQMWESMTQHGFWRGEVWNLLKNGEIHPFLMTITTVTDNTGEVLNYVGIFVDLTESKKNEEQRLNDETKYRDSLVREVHHQIKNNLQSVATLPSNMTFNYPELSVPIDSAIAKVNSIAIVHGIQASHAKCAIRVVELVKAIVDNNHTIFNCNISVQMPEDISTIFIVESEAVPVAIILNELLLNAIKHSDNANFTSLEINYDTTQQKLSLTIKNIGRIAIDPVSNQPEFGTGLQLVKSLMPKKSMDLSWKQDDHWVVTAIIFSSRLFQ